MAGDPIAVANARGRRLNGLPVLEMPEPLTGKRRPLATTIGAGGQTLAHLRVVRRAGLAVLLAAAGLVGYGLTSGGAVDWLPGDPAFAPGFIIFGVIVSLFALHLLTIAAATIHTELKVVRITITRSGLFGRRRRQGRLADYHGVADFRLDVPRYADSGEPDRAGSLLLHDDPERWVVLDRRLEPLAGRSYDIAAFLGIEVVPGTVMLYPGRAKRSGGEYGRTRSSSGGWFDTIGLGGDGGGGNGGGDGGGGGGGGD